MIINNQKYSCEACIRGHRVTTCKHHDRPLTKINRKGRPFSTCTVCHRTPCPAPDEHGRLRRERDDVHKKPNRYTRPFSGFLPIAPRPRPRPLSVPEMQTGMQTETRTQTQRQTQTETQTERQDMQGRQSEREQLLDFPFDIEFDLPLDIGIGTGIETDADTGTGTGIGTDAGTTSTESWPYPKMYGWEDISISTPVPIPMPATQSIPAMPSTPSTPAIQSMQSMQSMQMPENLPMSMSMPWEPKSMGAGMGMGVPTNDEWMGLRF